MKPIEEFSLLEFQTRFSTEDDCEAHLFKLRWPEGYRCPKCHHHQYYRIATRRLYQCKSCRHQTSITAGTMMHKSKIPLVVWFWAIYLCVTDKRGHSALSLVHQLGISYPTAWLLLHKIRAAMSERDAKYQFFGHVEMDDTFVGGVSKCTPGTGDRSGGGTQKARVIVALSVDAEGTPKYLRMRHVDRVTRQAANDFIRAICHAGCHITSDANSAYGGLAAYGITHQSKVYYQSEPEFLRWLHTVVSNLKVFISGTYHGLGHKHLQRYLDEFCYRFNRRQFRRQLFDRLVLAGMSAKHLRWRDLVFSPITETS